MIENKNNLYIANETLKMDLLNWKEYCKVNYFSQNINYLQTQIDKSLKYKNVKTIF